MRDMHPMMILACVLFSAVALAPVSYLLLAPDVLPVGVESVDAAPANGTTVATPNRDPHDLGLAPPPTAAAAAVATPNHDANRMQATPSFALNPGGLRAEPEAAALSAPAFVGTDTMLYAKDSARLRAAPSTAADLLTTLAADTPLRATARSSDGAWWRVSLAAGRTGYIHQTAVTQHRVAKAKPPVAPAPAVAVASPPPVSARRSQGLLGYVDETMNWLADTAGRGSAPTIARTER